MNLTKSSSNSLTKGFRSLHLQYHHHVRSPNSRLYQSSNLYNEFIEFMPNIKMYGIIFWVFSISDKNFWAFFGSIFRINHWSRICAGCIYSLPIFWRIVTILYLLLSAWDPSSHNYQLTFILYIPIHRVIISTVLVKKEKYELLQITIYQNAFIEFRNLRYIIEVKNL